MSDKRRNWNIATRLNHPLEVPIHKGNKPLISPIYQSAKFTLSEDYPYWDQFLYSRISNPTIRQLEMTLAEIQRKEDCVVFASGIAAITGTFLSLLSAGDHLISFRELYKPARTYIREFLPRYNINQTILSINTLERLEETIIHNKTKLIHFESPTNPNLDIADIDEIIRIAKRNDVLVSMDGTFAGLHQHTEFDVDIMIHSLTKFGNGHGDVIAGAVAGKKNIISKIREMNIYLGATMDPHAAYLIERGLKTYMLRFERQADSAFKIAKFLSSHPKVNNLKYPGLESHPKYELARKQMKSPGAVISFGIDPSVAASADKFCHKFSLIQLAASLGSTETIICPTMTFFGEDLTEEERKEVGINSHTLRLSVGLEAPEDIIEDINEALG